MQVFNPYKLLLFSIIDPLINVTRWSLVGSVSVSFVADSEPAKKYVNPSLRSGSLGSGTFERYILPE